ncbi:phospholipase D-like domain-containing protein [Alicyclobacillus fodiniaquatilis]|uniref:phospholipase D n=1 Tax=Alicyclobacillus fodiniaquatilis TaxID=1661150 RepID=A0ABW4JDC2_9BACL
MKHTNSFLRRLATGFLCLFAVALVGCTPKNGVVMDTTQRLPQQVTTKSGIRFVWGPEVKQAALQLIAHSHHEVYLEMYELSDPDIMSALAEAHKHKLDVRVVLDATESHSTETGFPTLQKDGVNVRQLSIKEGIDHVKMLVTDDGVLIGGMNFGDQSWKNNDASVVIMHPNASFKTMFLWDFARAGGQAVEAPTLQLPLVDDAHIQTAVLHAIQTARKTIDMEAFVLSDKQVVSALEAAVGRGVALNLLVDPTEYYNRASVDALRNAGAMVRYYRPYDGELMHAKIIDVDDGKTFIIGSANFSHQAYTYNHEADVVLQNVPQLDASFRDDLSTQMARGTDYPMKESQHAWG